MEGGADAGAKQEAKATPAEATAAREEAFKSALSPAPSKKPRVEDSSLARVNGDPSRRSKVTGKKSAVWSIMPLGFSSYHDQSLSQYVVCNTCVADEKFSRAEINYGKDKSTTNVQNHMHSFHSQYHDQLLLARDEKI